LYASSNNLRESYRAYAPSMAFDPLDIDSIGRDMACPSPTP
jgi:hypothetical protein